METIDYQLKCNPEVSVKVPAEYGKKADDLINTILKDVNELEKVTSEHPYLFNIGLYSRMVELIKKKSKRLQDIVYLRICVRGTERRLNNSDFSKKVVQMDHNLIQKIEWLEACKDI